MAKQFVFRLTELQNAILVEFAKSDLAKDFYWTGGTALAFFHLQHRYSQDIDLFTNEAIEHERLVHFVKKLSRTIGLEKIEVRRVFDRHEFYLKNGGETRLEFARYDFKSLKRRTPWKGIIVDSLDDMAANKTMALLDRHEPKDAFDIYYLLTKKRFSPTRLLAMVAKKFGVIHAESSFWSQAIFAAKSLSTVAPLIPRGDRESAMLRKKIADFFQREGSRHLRAHILK